MAKKLTLQQVIEKFLKTHPNYKPNLSDIDICIRYAANNFAYITFSTESTTYKLRTKLEQNEEKIKKLTAENKCLKVFR